MMADPILHWTTQNKISAYAPENVLIFNTRHSFYAVWWVKSIFSSFEIKHI